MTPVTEDIDKLRLEIGDLDPDNQLYDNDQLRYFLDQEPNMLMAAANVCEALARRLAPQFDFKWKDQSFSRSQASKAYRELARDLRTRAMASAGGAPWSGGRSVARKEALAGEADRVQGSFARDQFSNR
jgi:hypothetical protein